MAANGDDRNDFARRQISALTRRGMEHGAARRRVEDLIGPLDERLFDAGAYPLLDDLVQAADLGSRAAEGLARGVIDRHAGHSGTFRQVLRAVATVQVYAVGVALVATVVWAVWLQFVGPQFAELYAAMGQPLPRLTQWFIDPRTGLLAFALIWGVVLLLGWAQRRLMGLLRALRSPGALILRLPATSRLARIFGDWLSVVCVAVAVRQGIAPERAVGVVGQWRTRNGLGDWKGKDGDSSPGLGSALETAARLGTLDEEAAHQSERLELEFPIQAARTREWLMVTLLVTFGVCIGAMVISMYLPIFELAAVI